MFYFKISYFYWMAKATIIMFMWQKALFLFLFSFLCINNIFAIFFGQYLRFFLRFCGRVFLGE